MEKNTTPNDPQDQRLLGIWAHPDDEAYLSAGLMARTIKGGGQVTLVTLTDGELGFPQDDPRSPAARALHRRTELRQAMAVIGVHDIRHLGIADGQVANAAAGPVVKQLAAVIAEVRPDTIVTFGPDGITGHDDHVANSRLATAAWLRAGVGDLWYATKTTGWLEEWSDIHAQLGVLMTDESTLVGRGEVDQDTTLTIDLTGADLAEKRRVLAGHASQTETVAGFFGEPNYLRWIGQESFRRPTATEQASVASAVTSITKLVA